MAKKDFTQMSTEILELVGGKSNIALFTHCVTRLRFTVRDKGLVKSDEITNINGVIGVQWYGEQFQVIIGNKVEEVYRTICNIADLKVEAGIDENLDGDKSEGNKFSLKNIGNKILAYTAPTMTGVIVMMMAACMCKTIVAVLGPGVLNVVSETSDFYLVMNFLYDAFFYFLPIFLGYSAAKTLNINPMYGIYLGALLIVPGFIGLVGVRESISIYGIAAPVANYSSSFLPVMLGVWIMSYVIKFLEKVIPNVLSLIFVPTLTVLIMTPIIFIVCAPLGTYIGDLIGSFFISMYEMNIVLRVVASVILAAIFPYLVLTGMHGALVTFAITSFVTNGYEPFLLPIMLAYNFAVFGVAFGAFLKVKKPEKKSEYLAYFATGILGSITEPALYGVVLKYKQAMKGLIVACAIVGLFVGILAPINYVMSSATVFTFWLPWVGHGTANAVSGIALMVIAILLGVGAGYMVDYEAEN